MVVRRLHAHRVMSDLRDEALRTLFTVTAVWQQPEPWQTDGLIPTSMPAGFFARLDPPLSSSDLGHSITGLGITITDPSGVSQPLSWFMGRLDETSRIILFFERTTDEQLPLASTIRFTVA